jgi:IS1 family transposase
MGRNWVHAAIASVSRFVIDLRVGPRTKETAVDLVGSVALCGGSAHASPPLFLVDDHLPYPSAILEVYGQVQHRRRRTGRGRRKHPRLKPPPGLLAGVVKKVRDAGGNLLRVARRGLFGSKRAVIARIQKLEIGETIHTAHIERLNGTLRVQQARLARRTQTLSRRRRRLQWSLWLWRDWYNWVRLHRSLPCQTPAMAQRMADHAWSVGEYLRHPVHVDDLQRALWADERQIAITPALNDQKRLKVMPTL